MAAAGNHHRLRIYFPDYCVAAGLFSRPSSLRILLERGVVELAQSYAVGGVSQLRHDFSYAALLDLCPKLSGLCGSCDASPNDYCYGFCGDIEPALTSSTVIPVGLFLSFD